MDPTSSDVMPSMNASDRRATLGGEWLGPLMVSGFFRNSFCHWYVFRVEADRKRPRYVFAKPKEGGDARRPWTVRMTTEKKAHQYTSEVEKLERHEWRAAAHA